MNELKPCPFCGGEATLVRNSIADMGVEAVYIKCKTCGATSSIYTIGNHRIPPRAKTSDECFAPVRNAWNRRVEDSKQTPKKPNKVHVYYYYKEGNCPSCGVTVDSKSNYCAKCGQKLDWEDKE